jgi:hypothetical protein
VLIWYAGPWLFDSAQHDDEGDVVDAAPGSSTSQTVAPDWPWPLKVRERSGPGLPKNVRPVGACRVLRGSGLVVEEISRWVALMKSQMTDFAFGAKCSARRDAA